ncbi:MAG: hypothetical protein M1820_007890 [Bogoriella megaspora]|nr:MAG: hypothetical protein M1820_007890 [Bogoriella megaspora]
MHDDEYENVCSYLNEILQGAKSIVYNRVIDLNYALHDAAEAGDDERVEDLLSCGADPNKPDNESDGAVPLQIAAEQGHEYVVECLLLHGAKVNHEDSRRQNALHSAISHFNRNNGMLETIQTLLDHGADPNLDDIENRTALHALAYQWPELIHRTENPLTPSSVLDTATRNFPITSQIALNRSPTPPEFSRRGEVARTLLAYGASPESVDFYGYTPLHAAATYGNNDVLSVLLGHVGPGFNLQHVETISRNTPLHPAADNNFPETVHLLLQAGANVNEQSVYGTALHMAAERGYEAVVNVLLQFNPNIDTMRISDNATASEAARQRGHNHIVAILKKYKKSMKNRGKW